MRTMANALQQVLAVAEYGARKYSPDNWLQVPDAVQRYTDAMLRHQQAHLRGEALDPESGCRTWRTRHGARWRCWSWGHAGRAARSHGGEVQGRWQRRCARMSLR